LAVAVGGLITATSANLSGQPPARTLAEAQRALGQRINVYLNGGTLGSDTPSTVVEFARDGSLRIVRPGAIDRDTIAATLGKR
jgi:tRNA A37 threonylcarbamoyladenosine synthetase subunit TsaC/SUA5/YrdC